MRIQIKISTLLSFSLLILISIFGCNTSGVFSTRSPHKAYGDKLIESGLHLKALGKAWFQAAQKSLDSPVTVTVPFKETGYFPPEKPSAAGYKFDAKQGEVVNVSITTTPPSGFFLFAELRKVGDKKSVLDKGDTLTKSLSAEIDNSGTYLLRIQPELLQGVGYTVSITTSPSLAFPVHKNDKPRIASFWGVARDGGSRKHEGVDIFAPKRTPVLAVSDGYVTSVSTNNLGGKVIFMRTSKKPYSIYYAHLDEQLVEIGESVLTGDTLGLMGNTGNARTTPPHLHFGIYTQSGAVDPLPFINLQRPAPTEITADPGELGSLKRLSKAVSINGHNVRRIESGTLITIIAASENNYRIELPDGTWAYINKNDITNKPIDNVSLKNNIFIQEGIYQPSVVKGVIFKGSKVSIIGKFLNLSYVKGETLSGWVPTSVL